MYKDHDFDNHNTLRCAYCEYKNKIFCFNLDTDQGCRYRSSCVNCYTPRTLTSNF